MNPIKNNPHMALVMALNRIRVQLERAETELPQLAAPDGTVAVQIDDLRAMVNEMDRMRDTLALGKQFWGARWHGSEPMKGSHIYTVTEHGGYADMLAFVGPDESDHKNAGIIVAAHNAAMNDFEPVRP